MRTQQEILDRIEERKEYDLFGFETGEYVDFLEFEHVKQYLDDGVTEEEWQKAKKENTREVILAIMEEYMEFAWGKANNCRGVSANRSIMHYQAWVWLLGDEDAMPSLWDDYSYYGKSELVLICDHYGWDWKQWDDDMWQNSEMENCVSAEVALNA